MTSALQIVIRFIVGIRENKDRILTNLNPDQIDNKIIKEQSKKIKSLEGQLSHHFAKGRKIKIEEEELKQEVELLKELKQIGIEMEKDRFDGAFPLNEIFKIS